MRLISCDWGTSAFRIRLLEGEESPVVRAARSGPRGISTFPPRAVAEYRDFLGSEILELLREASIAPEPIPVCLSGMITSSLGWVELPYACLPFGLEGGGAVLGRDVLERPCGVQELVFISGVRSDTDAMRGEECELVGIFAQPELRRFEDSALAIIPGTHSKWAEIRGGTIAEFNTFLTGEVFDLLCRHSVLRHSVASEAGGGDAPDEAFDEGVRRASERGLLASLFSVRTNSLFNLKDPAMNRRYLSGLVVGEEISAIRRSRHHRSAPVILSGSPALQRAYRRALDVLGESGRLHEVPAGVSGAAASLGHWRIFRARQR
jgi:2-dehydro-3-deoxygalactonokinase